MTLSLIDLSLVPTNGDRRQAVINSLQYVLADASCQPLAFPR